MQFDGTINAGNLLEAVIFLWGLVIYFARQDKKITMLSASIDSVKQDIARLEARQDKYNHLQERTIALEQRCLSNGHRIDGLEKQLDERIRIN
jgi:predicted RNase H-like nuclease (RuvC/YqgF family)